MTIPALFRIPSYITMEVKTVSVNEVIIITKLKNIPHFLFIKTGKVQFNQFFFPIFKNILSMFWKDSITDYGK